MTLRVKSDTKSELWTILDMLLKELSEKQRFEKTTISSWTFGWLLVGHKATRSDQGFQKSESPSSSSEWEAKRRVELRMICEVAAKEWKAELWTVCCWRIIGSLDLPVTAIGSKDPDSSDRHEARAPKRFEGWFINQESKELEAGKECL
jgi:hypothetical protein